MTLEELQAAAAKDLKMDDLELADESLKSASLHQKYLTHFNHFRQLVILKEGEYKVLYRKKWEYYGGKSDAKIYAAKPFDLKVLKTDLGVYINSDEDIMEIEMKIEYYETVVQFIEGIIKSIDNRSWDIKHAQDWKKFLAGGF